MHGLFDEAARPPHLNGQVCRNCGRVSFPPNPYGCEACGASGAEVAVKPLRGQGRLLAFVTTHHANQRDIAIPYTVASIALEDGPVIRALMKSPTGEGLKVDQPVEAVIVPRETAGGDQIAEVRFQTEAAN